MLLNLACGGCSQDLIDQLLLLVDKMQATINLLSNKSNVVSTSDQFNQLRNKALLVMVSFSKFSVCYHIIKIGMHCECLEGSNGVE